MVMGGAATVMVGCLCYREEYLLRLRYMHDREISETTINDTAFNRYIFSFCKRKRAELRSACPGRRLRPAPNPNPLKLTLTGPQRLFGCTLPRERPPARTGLHRFAHRWRP